MTDCVTISNAEVLTTPSSVGIVKLHPSTKRTAHRSLQLDILRGVAILLVLGRHLELPTPSGPVGAFASEWMFVGWVGVDLFFVLSGFLISGLLFIELKQHNRILISRFYIRRGLKLYPAYFVLLAYVFLMPMGKLVIGGMSPYSAARRQFLELWPNFIFLNNYIGNNPIGHTWSLCVEEHFYLLVPLIITLIPYSRLSVLPWAAAGCLLACLASRIITLTLWPNSAPFILEASHLRFDALLLGVGLRSIVEFRPIFFAKLKRLRWILITSGIILFTPAFLLDATTPMMVTVGVLMNALGSGFLLAGVIHLEALSPKTRMRRIVAAPLRTLGWIGFYSYSIYLWHVTTTRIVERNMLRLARHMGFESVPTWIISAVVVVVAATLVGYIAAIAVERPVLAIRNRLWPSRSSTV